MIKQLHLYDVIYDTREPVSVNFDKVLFFKPNTICKHYTDIYFGMEEKITVWESYDSLLNSF